LASRIRRRNARMRSSASFPPVPLPPPMTVKIAHPGGKKRPAILLDSGRFIENH